MAKLLSTPPQRLLALNRGAAAAVHLAASSSRRFNTPLQLLPPFPLFIRSSRLTFSRSSGRRSVPPFRASSSSSFSSSSSVDEAKGRGDGSPGSSSPGSSSGDFDVTVGGGDGSVGADIEKGNGGPAGKPQEFPSGELEIVEFHWWKRFVVRLRMLFALPWERVSKGSVLTIKLKGRIGDQLKSRFSSGLSLPQICENFTKAAYDPRISAIYLQIEPLNCGWGKVEEIRRHILYFRKSGKLIVCYVPICGEKEYYLACACEELYLPPSAYVALFGLAVQASFVRGILDKVGIEPQIQRIGKYKSAGDQIARRSMSKENCEMLTTLLDDIYGNWLDTISSTQGKRKDEIENFLNSGVYQVERLKEGGWITNILYDDEIISILKERLGQEEEKKLRMVDFSSLRRAAWTETQAQHRHGSRAPAPIARSGETSRSPSSYIHVLGKADHRGLGWCEQEHGLTFLDVPAVNISGGAGSGLHPCEEEEVEKKVSAFETSDTQRLAEMNTSQEASLFLLCSLVCLVDVMFGDQLVCVNLCR